MRGRKPKKDKVPRQPRPRKVDVSHRPRVYCPWQGDRVGVLLEEGPQQSIVRFDDADREFLPQQQLMVNEWFVRGTPRIRIKSKTKRVLLTRR